MFILIFLFVLFGRWFFIWYFIFWLLGMIFSGVWRVFIYWFLFKGLKKVILLLVFVFSRYFFFYWYRVCCKFFSCVFYFNYMDRLVLLVFVCSCFLVVFSCVLWLWVLEMWFCCFFNCCCVLRKWMVDWFILIWLVDFFLNKVLNWFRFFLVMVSFRWRVFFWFFRFFCSNCCFLIWVLSKCICFVVVCFDSVVLILVVVFNKGV